MVTKRKPSTKRKEESGNNDVAGGNYFSRRSSSLTFIPSGCTLLDCVLGGGWPLGRISNIIGDRSTGKSLLSIEAAANAAAELEDVDIHYLEAESAFDQGYAQALGMPIERVEFPEDIFTVESVFEYMERLFKDRDPEKPGLVIVDSLDALSDRAELGRDIDEGTYGASKAKKMSELFRRIATPVEKNNIHLMFISQTRQNINPGFGKKYTRSGGMALDFYASQIIHLVHTGRIKKTRKGIERAIGVEIKAQCEKNKVSMPFRECDFRIAFGYGIDDLAANIDWLISTKNIKEIGLDDKEAKKVKRETMTMPEEDFLDLEKKARDKVMEIWYEAEEGFVPKRRKYGG